MWSRCFVKCKTCNKTKIFLKEFNFFNKPKSFIYECLDFSYCERGCMSYFQTNCWLMIFSKKHWLKKSDYYAQ